MEVFLVQKRGSASVEGPSTQISDPNIRTINGFVEPNTSNVGLGYLELLGSVLLLAESGFSRRQRVAFVCGSRVRCFLHPIGKLGNSPCVGGNLGCSLPDVC